MTNTLSSMSRDDLETVLIAAICGHAHERLARRKTATAIAMAHDHKFRASTNA